MKRHESLAPFSREHHQSLILAQLLKKNAPAYKGLPQKPKQKAEYAFNMFDVSIQHHFKKEEELLERIKNFHEEIRRITDEIKSEHQHLNVSFKSLVASDSLVDDLDFLGRALEKHIGKEERVLFPLIQKNCPEEILNEVQWLLQ